MRVTLLALSLLLPALALAQEPPAEAPATPAPAAADTQDIDVGSAVFALADTPSTRFPDAEDEGPTFTPGSRLLVLVVEQGRLRVMSAADNQFGWIPVGSVTARKPDIDIDALLQSLGQDAGGAGAE